MDRQRRGSTKKNRNSLEGIISNYYFYKNNLGYSPRLKILELLKTNQSNRCLEEKIKGFSIILMLDIEKGDFPDYCLKEILDLKGLLITSNSNSFIERERTNLSLINIDRQEDLESMLAYANENTWNKNIVIDNLLTKDKTFIQNLWEEFGRITAKTTTVSETKNNEEILAELLLIKRSKDRARELSRAISSPVEHLPRRRGDIDSIFLSVDLLQARTLKPAIDYNFAESVGVYVVPNCENVTFLKNTLVCESCGSRSICCFGSIDIPTIAKIKERKKHKYPTAVNVFILILSFTILF